MSEAPKTFEMEVDANELGNLAWKQLHELLNDELGHNGETIEESPINEAETMLKFKRALATRSDFLLIRIRYDNPRRTPNRIGQ